MSLFDITRHGGSSVHKAGVEISGDNKACTART